MPRFHAEFTKIDIPNGPVPPPRTSHTCVSYKNRYLVVIGGENEEINKEDKSGTEEVNENNQEEENKKE